jgi:hypothetical protein
MRKLFLFLIPLLFALFVFLGFQLYFTRILGKGALQVTSTPISSVYINGKLVGKTPLCKCDPQDMLSIGTHTIRLVPTDAGLPVFEDKISIGRSVLTVVDRTFGEGATSEGSVITLTPIDSKSSSHILVMTTPDKSEIFLDSTSVGYSPYLSKTVTESDHEIKLVKEGYREKIVRIRAVKGYKLTTSVTLGVDLAAPMPTPTHAPSASPSAAVKPKITILQTPTGFLRVRGSPSVSGVEVARVTPGESFELIEEQEGWFLIQLPEDKEGWVSSQYSSKQ